MICVDLKVRILGWLSTAQLNDNVHTRNHISTSYYLRYACHCRDPGSTTHGKISAASPYAGIGMNQRFVPNLGMNTRMLACQRKLEYLEKRPCGKETNLARVQYPVPTERKRISSYRISNACNCQEQGMVITVKEQALCWHRWHHNQLRNFFDIHQYSRYNYLPLHWDCPGEASSVGKSRNALLTPYLSFGMLSLICLDCHLPATPIQVLAVLRLQTLINLGGSRDAIIVSL